MIQEAINSESKISEKDLNRVIRVTENLVRTKSEEYVKFGANSDRILEILQSLRGESTPTVMLLITSLFLLLPSTNLELISFMLSRSIQVKSIESMVKEAANSVVDKE